jgi:hypothetical protein
MQLHRISIDDTDRTNIIEHFLPCVDFIHSILTASNKEKKQGVLVHCQAGVSRSTTLVAAYLMVKKRMNVEQAVEKIKEVRSQVEPSEFFLMQLELFERCNCEWDPVKVRCTLSSPRFDSLTDSSLPCSGKKSVGSSCPSLRLKSWVRSRLLHWIAPRTSSLIPHHVCRRSLSVHGPRLLPLSRRKPSKPLYLRLSFRRRFFHRNEHNGRHFGTDAEKVDAEEGGRSGSRAEGGSGRADRSEGRGCCCWEEDQV